MAPHAKGLANWRPPTAKPGAFDRYVDFAPANYSPLRYELCHKSAPRVNKILRKAHAAALVSPAFRLSGEEGLRRHWKERVRIG